MRSKWAVALLSAGFLAPGVVGGNLFATTASSKAQADQAAIHAVGGGQVTHVSNDTYQGQAVYDIHVLYAGTVYDVKVAQSTGAVLQKKLSSESTPDGGGSAASSGTSSPTPAHAAVSASQGGQLAMQAVGGGSVLHISADHAQGMPVWDVHVIYQGKVWDVKISQANGSVVRKFLSREQYATRSSRDTSPDVHRGRDGRASQGSRDHRDAHDRADHAAASAPVTTAGVVYGVKLQTVPAAYEVYVNQALQQENGSLKWVKLIRKDNGNTQANIKIRRNQGGTVKVKDLFGSNGQLIQEKINH